MANPPYGPVPPGSWQRGPQQYPPQPAAYQTPTGPRYDNDKGFFGSLFDFSFDNFIATKLVKFLYVLSLIGATIFTIIMLVGGLVALGGGSDAAAGRGLLLMALAPIVWFVWLILTRLYLELVIVMFNQRGHQGHPRQRRWQHALNRRLATSHDPPSGISQFRSWGATFVPGTRANHGPVHNWPFTDVSPSIYAHGDMRHWGDT